MNATEPVPDDEREALARLLYDDLMDGVGATADTAWVHDHNDDTDRYVVQIDGDIEVRRLADSILAAGYRRPGQITDAQVEAGAAVAGESRWLPTGGYGDRQMVRAMLEAARDAS